MNALFDHFPNGCWVQPDGGYAGECICGKTFAGGTYLEAKAAWASHAALATTPSPDALPDSGRMSPGEARDETPADREAKALYAAWTDRPGWVPWIEGGNSVMQDEARRIVASPWRWWAGANEEEYRLAGPCLTREEALAIAGGEARHRDVIYLIEAITAPGEEGDRLHPFIETRNESSVVWKASA